MSCLLLIGIATNLLSAVPPDERDPSDRPSMPALDWSRTPLTKGLVEMPQPNPWLDWQPGEWDPRRHQGQLRGPFGSITSQLILRDPGIVREQPVVGDEWRANESWKLDFAGPVYLFGEVGAGADPFVSQELRMSGRTGLGWRLPVVVPGAEVQVRSGPSLSVTDPLRQEPVRSRPELFLELQARCPLARKLGLEYQGSAVPAFTPLEHDRVSQDIRLAVPLGSAGKFRLGAKHQWQNAEQPRPWTEGMQVYFGIELGR